MYHLLISSYVSGYHRCDIHPIGEGGIGIVRLSGKDALAIAQRLFSKQLANRRLVYGHIVDPDSGEVVDEVLAAYMKAPHTIPGRISSR